MPSRKEIVDAARSLVGTPFHHQARVPGRKGGMDCIGVLVCTSRLCGGEPHDFTAYGRDPDPKQLLKHLAIGMTKIPIGSAGRGDAFLIWWEMMSKPQHFVLLTDNDLIVHSYDGLGGVREQRMPPAWRRQIHSAWAFKGVTG